MCDWLDMCSIRCLTGGCVLCGRVFVVVVEVQFKNLRIHSICLTTGKWSGGFQVSGLMLRLRWLLLVTCSLTEPSKNY